VVRKGHSTEVLYSLDGREYISIRVGCLPLEGAVDTGITCASPEGHGFSASFEEVRLIQPTAL